MSGAQIAELRGARLAWWSDGEGPPLVLVHAGVADARMWKPVLPALTAGHRVISYDMRGFGSTRSAAGTWAAASGPDVRSLVVEMQRTASCAISRGPARTPASPAP